MELFTLHVNMCHAIMDMPMDYVYNICNTIHNEDIMAKMGCYLT